MFFKKGIFKNVVNLITVAGPATLVNIPLRKRFPLKFAKCLRTPFFTEHLRWPLLKIQKKSNMWKFFVQYCRL